MNGRAPVGISHWDVKAGYSWPIKDRALPLITANQARAVLPGTDLWDMWPLELPDGETALFGDRSLWFVLSAPALPDPVERHLHARIRLMSQTPDECWHDHGLLLPDDWNPGEREWSGSALWVDQNRVTLFYTAAGLRDAPGGFQQRLFETTGTLTGDGESLRLTDWTEPREMFRSDGVVYDPVDRHDGAPGTVKAFRDPAWFRDPADGRCYVTFAASAGCANDPHNGMVGLARLESDGWQLLPPILSAAGVNNELERPHIRWRNGLYYLFWSTQTHTFSPHVSAGPNGLYAMAAWSLSGPWHPVNGDGLVACNPDAEPRQAYSWVVTGEWAVYSFVDYWGLAGRSPDHDPMLLRDHFGGTPAPVFLLEPDGGAIRLRA